MTSIGLCDRDRPFLDSAGKCFQCVQDSSGGIVTSYPTEFAQGLDYCGRSTPTLVFWVTIPITTSIGDTLTTFVYSTKVTDNAALSIVPQPTLSLEGQTGKHVP